MFSRSGVTIIDVSSYQESVDFRVLKEKKIWGVYLRATMGKSDVDSLFATRVIQAHSAGLRVGTYHFAYPNLNPGLVGAAREANHYAATTRRFRLHHLFSLRPMLDLEVEANGVEEWARHFNRICISRSMPLPLFYSYSDYIVNMNIKNGPIGAGLVIAAYGRNDGKEYPVYAPKPWKHYVAHQFTSNGTVPGVSGHCDVWHSPKPKALLSPRVINRTLDGWFSAGAYSKEV